MARVGVILAGGLGKRMKSDLPKPAHKIGQKSMLQIVIEKLDNIGCERIYVVYGKKGDMLQSSVIKNEKIVWVHQEPQLGTGHALQVAYAAVDRGDKVLVCNGDAPFVREETMEKLFSEEKEGVMLVCDVKDPFGYGRVIEEESNFRRIVEEKDATEEEKKVTNINAGAYCFRREILEEYLGKLDNNNAQGEYYLTDLMGMMVENERTVGIVKIEDEDEIYNVNSREQLDYARSIMDRFI